MENKTTDILVNVADYYFAKLAEHGATPRGVDWNGEESHVLRFAQLAKVIRGRQGFRSMIWGAVMVLCSST